MRSDNDDRITLFCQTDYGAKTIMTWLELPLKSSQAEIDHALAEAGASAKTAQEVKRTIARLKQEVGQPKRSRHSRRRRGKGNKQWKR